MLCNEIGNYKRYFPKSGKENRENEESHVTDEREELDAKKYKKEEVNSIYYD